MKIEKKNSRKITVLIAISLLLMSGFVIVSMPTEAQFKSGIVELYIPTGTRFEPGSYQRLTFTHFVLGKSGNTTGFGGLFSISTMSATAAGGDTSTGLNGGSVKIVIPEGWSLPQITDPTGEGFVTVTPGHNTGIVIGTITTIDRNLTIPIISGSDEGERVIVVYGETAFGSPGAKVQNESQKEVEFEVWENPDITDPDGWIKIEPSPTVMVVYPWEGIGGDINIITTQAIGVQSISFVGWNHDDDTAIGVVTEDTLSYTIGMQLNNGDEYDNTGQHVRITFRSDAKTEMIVKLHTELSITNPDQADEATENIHIWYKGLEENVVGQIDPWNYLIRIPAASSNQPGTLSVMMCVNVGNTVLPGFYEFQTYIEPTNWEEVKTVNMG